MPQILTALPAAANFPPGFTVDPLMSPYSCAGSRNAEIYVSAPNLLGWSITDGCAVYSQSADGNFNRAISPPGNRLLLRDPSGALHFSTAPNRSNAAWSAPVPALDDRTRQPLVRPQIVMRWVNSGRAESQYIGPAETRCCDHCGHRQHIDDFPDEPTPEQVGTCNRCVITLDTNYSVDWRPGEPVTSRAADQIGSTRKFGIELELLHAPGFRSLRSRNWGAHRDGSVSNGIELVSPILQGNSGLDVIHAATDLAQEKGWKVDKRCGFHLHLDVNNLDTTGIYRICSLYRHLQWFLFFLVDHRRRDSTYTKPWTADIDSLLEESRTATGFTKFIQHPIVRNDRYYLLNVDSIRKHGSLEIRLHQGTTNREKIYHWIRFHAHLFDWAVKANPERVAKALALGRTIPKREDTQAAVASIWEVLSNRIPDDTAAFYVQRAAELHQYDLRRGLPLRENPQSIEDAEVPA